jgi:TPP-dependent pyruvate/acetoin dehydrogenase alpha subunit
LQKEELLSLYLQMYRIRTFEEKCIEFAQQGLMPTNPHLAIGQEATIVGIIGALRADDYVTTTHRGHGHNVARGADMGRLLAEILGRRDGFEGGRGGSMHAASIESNVMGSFPIIGDSISVGTGLGLACRLKKEGRVVATFFGDGAANIGAFHEGLNMASVWKLPVVYVCENNLYAISTHITKSTSVKRISERASAYGIPGVTVDGMEIEEVYKAAREAVDRARESGPSLIECLTYRFRGSSEGEPGNPRKLKYRTAAELDEWLKRDPVKTVRAKLEHVVDNGALALAEKEIAEQVASAGKFALASPLPTPASPLISEASP